MVNDIQYGWRDDLHAINQKHPYTKKGLAHYLFENKRTITHDKFYFRKASLPYWVEGWTTNGNILLVCMHACFRAAMCSNCHRVSHPTWPSGSPRRSKIKQQSAQHSKQLSHEVGKSGAVPYRLFIMPHISKCCTKYIFQMHFIRKPEQHQHLCSG